MKKRDFQDDEEKKLITAYERGPAAGQQLWIRRSLHGMALVSSAAHSITPPLSLVAGLSALIATASTIISPHIIR